LKVSPFFCVKWVRDGISGSASQTAAIKGDFRLILAMAAKSYHIGLPPEYVASRARKLGDNISVMGHLMFVYTSGAEKGKTRIFTQDHITIGTSDACDLKLVPEREGGLPEGVLADIYNDDGLYHMVARVAADGLPVLINGEPAVATEPAGCALRNGDSLQFGEVGSGATVLFHVLPENFGSLDLAHRHERRLEKPSPVHPLTATLFVKELAASLWAEIPGRAKRIFISVLASLVVLFVAAVFFNFFVLYRNAREIERQREQIAAAAEQRQKDLEIIRKQQEEIERLREIGEQTRLFAQKVAERYSAGVCLIVGSYTFVERGSGRLLRYESADYANEPPIDQSGNLLASVDGSGPPVRIEFTGTGFVVDDGLIVTNKHVVQPWTADQIAQVIIEQGGGFRPRPDRLIAYFPSIKTPFELGVVKVSESHDLALCTFDQGKLALPSLPLSKEDPGLNIGESVVLLGYPTGVEGLLQRIDEGERRAILGGRGRSIQEIAAGLAERGLIRPLTTTGVISDALPNRVAHSAPTAEGGSGSPLFDRDGRVIAVNSAILASLDSGQIFGGSNFSVPIRLVVELLNEYRREK
jgi:serine protease Do